MKTVIALSFLCHFFLSSVTIAATTYTALIEDIATSKKISLISGVDRKRFEEGKAVMTIGREHSGHTMIVFEIMEKSGKIGLEALHLNAPKHDEDIFLGSDYLEKGSVIVLEFLQPCGGRVFVEKRRSVLKKCVRALRKNSGSEDSITVCPTYDKMISIIFDKDLALKTLRQCKKDKPLYSFAGTSVFDREAHNCCTYTAKVLSRIGVDTSDWTRFTFRASSLKEKFDAGALKGFETFIPPSSEVLLRQIYGDFVHVGDKFDMKADLN